MLMTVAAFAGFMTIALVPLHSLLRYFVACASAVPEVVPCGRAARSGIGRHRDPYWKGRATPELEPRSGRTRLPAIVSRSSPCARSLCTGRATTQSRTPSSTGSPQSPDQIREVGCREPLSHQPGPADLPSRCSLMAPISRAVPGYQSRHFEIAMGRVVSPGRGHRVSSRLHGTWPPASTLWFVPRCGRKDGCPWPRGHCLQRRRDVGLQRIVLSATRQPVNPSTRDAYFLIGSICRCGSPGISTTREGIRHVGDLKHLPSRRCGSCARGSASPFGVAYVGRPREP